MFTIFLSDAMDPFYQNIASFPTVVFTFFLGLSVLYWLVAVLGWVSIDVLDFDFDLTDGTDGALGTDTPDVLAGLMMKLGLTGVPVTIVVSLLSLVGWFISYFIVHFLFVFIPDGILRYVAGLPVLFVSLYLAALVTGRLIAPLRPFFEKVNQEPLEKRVLGQTAVVRTTTVDDQFGEAFLDDGGAGLILKVRATGNETFQHGDRVVLLEFKPEDRVYRVISEKEFNGT